ncbi:5'-3' exonuclease [Candidatus Palibaumannia cicadellinicola]|uniref:DNA polymerase I n=1 Tax=Baumannia cicadellinicola subsp. Homalodisca coagulata TaxID=374463 RepID=Q1LTX9_BAUCH|nr:5'-3' exonuclease H3TH domain-containing protein [Candidatus Baumannia cicadellinicola]ABF14215.1 DNA polymerase I [Baumannia cicadellinicola str. Hc (Homalodisca coagulata)]MBS0032640.1 flap endonuclease [Candidatus Baumannia cicadellinicola]MCJ7462432.1 flap endonuclease [Candidatus Baumannia cicadellinicola]MCJ7463036.1 flap endonuclease [Candidatus Baumannia cicadellinicola]
MLLLVDGSFYLYRAYHAFPLLTNNLGEPTGAIYGVINMLNSLFKQYSTSSIAIIFDAYGQNFRHKIFHDYKLNRTRMSKDLSCQIDPLYKIIQSMGLPLLVVKGVESDDVIGTLAHQAMCNNINVLISTGDKDMAQLVSPKIHLFNSTMNMRLGPKEVQKKFGVLPELIIDYIALVGDKSDNIPGVPGIGKKTAKILLQQFGGLKFLYQNLHKLNHFNLCRNKNLATKLDNYREKAFLSYQLATIRTNVMLDITYDQLIVKEPDYNQLIKLFKHYEFKRWILQLQSAQFPYNKAALSSNKIIGKTS